MKILVKKIYIFLIMWQFFFFDNVKLRFYPYLFWPIMAGIAAIYMISRKNIKFSKEGCRYFVAMLVALISSIISSAPEKGFIFLMEIILYYICVNYACSTEREIRTTVKIAYGFSFFHLVFLFLQRFIPVLFDPIAGAIRGNVVTYSYSNVAIQGEVNVYFGLTGQTSTLSLYLIFGLLMSFYLHIREKKNVYYVHMAVFVVGVFLTNRRANSLCGVALIVLYFALENSKLLKKILVATFVMVIVSIVGVRNIPGVEGIIAKFELGQVYSNTTSGRILLWESTYQMFVKNPALGIGFNNFSLHSIYVNAHNSYLQKLCELGILGVGIFFSPFIYMGRTTMSNLISCNKRKDTNYELYGMAVMAFLFFAYTTIISIVEGMFEIEIFYVMLFVFQKIITNNSKGITCISRRDTK